MSKFGFKAFLPLLILFSIATSLVVVHVYKKNIKAHELITGDKKIIAIYTRPDSVKVVEILLRRVVDAVETDSATGEKRIVTRTIYGFPIVDSVRDKTGKAILDSVTKKPSFRIAAYDSVDARRVFTDIGGRDYDSLMKADLIKK